jgi:isoquinoline 1-oxidoreductase beta subunit
MHGGGGRAAADGMPYTVPDREVTWAPLPASLPAGLWRAVDAGPACFAIETLMTAAADATAADPLAFRLRHLNEARARRVLQMLQTRSGWPTPSRPGATALGCALNGQTGSWCGVVAEVQAVDGAPRVTRLVAVVDGGRIVHPDGARAQVEGAMLMGLSAALRESTGCTSAGQPDVRQFDQYPLLRLPQVPVVEVYLLPSDEPPQGLGEVALPPVAPAVAGAWHALTGELRVNLPLLPPA